MADDRYLRRGCEKAVARARVARRVILVWHPSRWRHTPETVALKVIADASHAQDLHVR